MAMIVYAREGMVLEADVVRRFPVDGRVHVSLETDQEATLTTRGMRGRTADDKTKRLFQLCDERRAETLRVKVLRVTDEGTRVRILVAETNEPLTRNSSSAATSQVRPAWRTPTARPTPRAGAMWDRQRVA